MNLLEPIFFEPLLMERVWGGRRLESLFGKRLPPGVRVGESWELVDREAAQSVVHAGPLKGRTLGELWSEERERVFGARYLGWQGRFPLLFKLLDAEERLSVQVHPPAHLADELNGEPKTEMWYVAQARPGADLFVGLREGGTREAFAKALTDGRVAELLHRVEVSAGDAIFIPSGRVHAIGAGNLIVEVQQNSDTTYRVFDWNRVGLDSKPRELHVEESLRSIDFGDFEPDLATKGAEPLVGCEFFTVEEWELNAAREGMVAGEFAVFVVLEGEVACGEGRFGPGQFFLLPACMAERSIAPTGERAKVLRVRLPFADTL